MMAEDERALTQRRASPARTVDQVGVARRRQIAWAFDAALAPRIGFAPEEEQRHSLGGHTTNRLTLPPLAGPSA